METTVDIDALDDDGRGVGAAGGLQIHVAGALPGETAVARIEHRSPHGPQAWARLVRLSSPPSPDRVAPACPAFGRCGGCPLQHLAYPAQLAEKRRRVARALGREVDPVVPSPALLRYRNKGKYVVGPSFVLGSYAPGTHQVVDMAGCQVLEEPIDAVASALRDELAGAGLAVYDETTRRGDVRHAVIRSNHQGRALVVIVVADASSRSVLAGVATALRRRVPAVAGVVANVNPTTGGAIFGATDLPLDGETALPDEVGGVRLVLSARAFFQVNRSAAAGMYEDIARLAEPRPGLRVVDLFSGAGGIALTLAARGADVVGVESHAEAVEDARRSAAALGLGARFVAADAAAGLAEPADLVVVNPPRKGLGPDTRTALLRARPPRILYVSCGPRSLGHDLGALGSAYEVAAVRPFDLMPGTPQVETVVLLRSR